MSEFSCCWPAPLGRRHFLTLAGIGASALAFGWTPRLARAADGIDSLLLNCIDYRLTSKTTTYMESRGLKDNYDQVILAGAALGAVTPKYPDWGKTFREHVDIAIQLHNIKRIIVLDHRDCGAYKVFLGKDLTGDAEKALHATELHRLTRRIHTAHPKLAVETLLMALDGSVETVA